MAQWSWHFPPLQKAIQENHTGNRALSNNLIKVQEVKAAMADIAAEAAKKAQRREAADEGGSPVHGSSGRDVRSSSTEGQGREAKSKLVVDNNVGHVLEQRDKAAINVESQAMKPSVAKNGTTSKKSTRPAKSPILLDEEYYSGLTDRR